MQKKKEGRFNEVKEKFQAVVSLKCANRVGNG